VDLSSINFVPLRGKVVIKFSSPKKAMEVRRAMAAAGENVLLTVWGQYETSNWYLAYRANCWAGTGKTASTIRGEGLRIVTL